MDIKDAQADCPLPTPAQANADHPQFSRYLQPTAPPLAPYLHSSGPQPAPTMPAAATQAQPSDISLIQQLQHQLLERDLQISTLHTQVSDKHAAAQELANTLALQQTLQQEAAARTAVLERYIASKDPTFAAAAYASPKSASQFLPPTARSATPASLSQPTHSGGIPYATPNAAGSAAEIPVEVAEEVDRLRQVGEAAIIEEIIARCGPHEEGESNRRSIPVRSPGGPHEEEYRAPRILPTVREL